MKQFLIAASLLISATCFSQHDTRTVGGCGFRTEETAFSTLALMACPNQDETVASYNVYGQGSGWCWTVTFICTGINSNANKDTPKIKASDTEFFKKPVCDSVTPVLHEIPIFK